MNAEEIIDILGLQPHPEGGYYRETYRAAATIPARALPGGYDGDRAYSTAIYFLITADRPSAPHRVRSDEVFHFHAGSPAELLLIDPEGNAHEPRLGTDLAAGERPQMVVPAGWWQAVRVADGGAYTLLGTTVAPGFDFGDFELADLAALAAAHPELAPRIHKFS